MRTFVLTCILAGLITSLSWQLTTQPEQGYLFESDSIRLQDLHRIIRSTYPEMQIRSIYPSLGYYLLEGANTWSVSAARKILSQWQEDGIIDDWYYDHPVEVRTTPNDSLWTEQWDLDRIDLPDAWDITTGGITAHGDTIVVAILDDGYDVDHPDLKENFWINRAEIPNDGIDNDLNGYIDDYLGLNVQEGNDSHPKESHGTSVSGIIGAVGNNVLGVTGVNWSVKLLLVSGIKKESDLIEAYYYVMQMRKRYNDTNGREGPFVVVTNSSIGVEGAWADDNPMWCAAYDDMGQTGILSVASTTNRSSLVDEEGDMPSTCSSPFLITVTNTDIDDSLFEAAGYGPLHVDLGAPGKNSITTVINGAYGRFGGTSAASAHVAGAVALLYSVPCEDLMIEVNRDRVTAALKLKSLVLEGVDALESLEGKTLTGGRLNVNTVFKSICTEFGAPSKDLAINTIFPNPSRGNVRLQMTTSRFDEHVIRIFDSSGRVVHETKLFPPGEFFEYEFAVPGGIPGLYVALLEYKNDHTSYAFVVQ